MGKTLGLSQKHLLATPDLSREDIRYLLNTARAFDQYFQTSETPEPIPILKNTTIVHFFFEDSTRTRISFDVAVRRLSGQAIQFSASSSSVRKGETLIDTAKVIQAMKPHALIVRHSSAGSPQVLAEHLQIPVINAGDGFHEHPTQGLLDVLTMEKQLGDLKGKNVLIIGDIAHSRVARSNINLLRKLGATVTVSAPPTFLPPQSEAYPVKYAYRLEEALPDADVVMALRIQSERQTRNRMQIPSTAEYARFWGLNRERVKLMKPGAIILHPGPVNRGVELEPEVADSPISVILDQVSNGIVARMAVLAAICQPQRLQQWLEERGAV